MLLGLLLIFLIVLLDKSSTSVPFQQQEASKKAEISYQTLPFDQYIKLCLEKTMQESLDLVSQQGGYHQVPSSLPLLFFNETRIPVYAKIYQNPPQNVLSIPTKEVLEQELKRSIQTNYGACLHLQYPNAVVQEVKTAYLLEQEINAEITVISETHSETERQEVGAHAGVRLTTSYYKLFSFIKNFLEHHQESELPLGALTKLAQEQHLVFSFLQLDGPQFIVKITDPERDESFQYGVIYDW